MDENLEPTFAPDSVDMREHAAALPAENGNGNGAVIGQVEELTIPDKPTRRRSGFASPTYWDETGPEGKTRREEKSIWAKQMALEGKFGGRQPGAGRPRKNKSVAEVVTEKASEKADIIARELLSMVTHKSPSIKLGAMDRINKFEQDLEKNMRDDEKELRKLSGKSLDEALAEVLKDHGIGYDIDLPSSEVEEE